MSPQYDRHIMKSATKEHSLDLFWQNSINSVIMPWGEPCGWTRAAGVSFAPGLGFFKDRTEALCRIHLAQDRSPRDSLTSAKCFVFSTAGWTQRCWDNTANPAWQSRTTKSLFVSPKRCILKATGSLRLALWSRQLPCYPSKPLPKVCCLVGTQNSTWDTRDNRLRDSGRCGCCHIFQLL